MSAITNPHSPCKYRVNGLVVNMPEFEKAFFCKAGQPMTKEKPLSHLVTDISTSCLRRIERGAQLGHFYRGYQAIAPLTVRAQESGSLQGPSTKTTGEHGRIAPSGGREIPPSRHPATRNAQYWRA